MRPDRRSTLLTLLELTGGGAKDGLSCRPGAERSTRHGAVVRLAADIGRRGAAHGFVGAAADGVVDRAGRPLAHRALPLDVHLGDRRHRHRLDRAGKLPFELHAGREFG
jgi:hypothetical protein